MATGAHFVAKLAAELHITPERLELSLRKLWTAGIIPTSGKGGRIPPVHFDQHHAAAILLATVALTPATAVQTVQLIGSLQRGGSGPTLAEQLADEIATVAAGFPKPDWSLTVCLKPPGAKMERVSYTQLPSHQSRSLLRITVFGPGALRQCGALYAETVAQSAYHHAEASPERLWP